MVDGFVTEIALADIMLDPRFQARKGVDLDTVKRYADLYEDGVHLPPLEGINLDGQVYLIEGWHRYNALKRAELETCDIIISQGTAAQAKRMAAGSNATHGKPRSPEDTKVVVRLALESIGEMDEGEWQAWLTEKRQRAPMGQGRDGWSSSDIALITGIGRQWAAKIWPDQLLLDSDASRRERTIRRLSKSATLAQGPSLDAPRQEFALTPITWEPADPLTPVARFGIVDHETGEILHLPEPELTETRAAIADRAHQMVQAIVGKAFLERTRGQEINEAEHRAAIRTTRVDQLRTAVRDLLAVAAEDMAEDWIIDRRNDDLSATLAYMTQQLAAYADAVQAAQVPRLRAVK